MTDRVSGIVVPLFSLASSRSWGVGEFLDLPRFAEWLIAARQDIIQVLPLTEIPDEVTSPYSSLTAMALDPIYISLPAMADFAALGGEAALDPQERETLAALRSGSRVDHTRVRRLKSRWLRRAFERFARDERRPVSRRAQAFAAFANDESWWLDDYAVFRALRERYERRPWWDWPAPLARRDRNALDEARRSLAAEIEFRMYVQWVAAEQWADARRVAQPLRIYGDLPFMISGDSPDVWTNQHAFRFDATVGVPPDAFSETGQDWGLPPWRWEVMARTDFLWMRQRARRTAHLFDGFRLDHLVGLYRTYIRPIDEASKNFFAPSDEPSQLALGEHLVRLYLDSGAAIIAEDLGTVPDFVRASLARLGVPGFKVFRWERQWQAPGQPFIDPADYPEVSVATTGTHDTEPLALWWEALPADQRVLLLQIPSVRRHVSTDRVGTLLGAAELPPRVLEACLRSVLDGHSALALLPLQDVFGWRARINTPAQVDEENWTWRLPWPVDRLGEIDDAATGAARLAEWTTAAGRRSGR
jgi:4-alpha-glucanotransferase